MSGGGGKGKIDEKKADNGLKKKVTVFGTYAEIKNFSTTLRRKESKNFENLSGIRQKKKKSKLLYLINEKLFVIVRIKTQRETRENFLIQRHTDFSFGFVNKLFGVLLDRVFYATADVKFNKFSRIFHYRITQLPALSFALSVSLLNADFNFLNYRYK